MHGSVTVLPTRTPSCFLIRNRHCLLFMVKAAVAEVVFFSGYTGLSVQERRQHLHRPMYLQVCDRHRREPQESKRAHLEDPTTEARGRSPVC